MQIQTERPQLSSRERQIVALIRQAKANKEIASELCLSQGTVKEYLNRIFKKLQVRSRTELALHGLGQPAPLFSGSLQSPGVDRSLARGAAARNSR